MSQIKLVYWLSLKCEYVHITQKLNKSVARAIMDAYYTWMLITPGKSIILHNHYTSQDLTNRL